MKNILSKTLACSSLLLFGLSITVQAAPQDHWYQEREGFFHGEAWRMHLFDRVRDDLRHVREVDFRGSDQYRIARTIEQLNSLQSKMAAHQYDHRNWMK